MPTDAFTDEELLAMCALADDLDKNADRPAYVDQFLDALRRVGLWGEDG